MFSIKYRIRAKRTNERVGFLLRDEITGSLRVATLDQALNLANSNMIDGVKVTFVNGKPMITAIGNLKLSDIPEITDEGLKSLVLSRKSDTSISQTDTRPVLSLVNIYYLSYVTSRSSRVPYVYTGNKQTILGYDLMFSNTSFEIGGKLVNAGESFYVPFDEFANVLNTIGPNCDYKNFLANGNKIVNYAGSVMRIIVGKLDVASGEYIWDSQLHEQYNRFMSGGNTLQYSLNVIGTKVSDTNIGSIKLSERVLSTVPDKRTGTRCTEISGDTSIYSRITGQKPNMQYTNISDYDKSREFHNKLMSTIQGRSEKHNSKVKNANGILGLFNGFNKK